MLGFDDAARCAAIVSIDPSDEDLAVFAAYPVVEQEEVAISSAKPKRNRRRGKASPRPSNPPAAPSMNAPRITIRLECAKKRSHRWTQMNTDKAKTQVSCTYLQIHG
ncbi:MAG: hypothetical protein R2851_25410 [Caldilineaceae bacterium]